MRVCTEPGCGGKVRRRGMCDIHYQRWRAATPPEHRRRPTPEQRLRERIDQRGPNECWPWRGGVSNHGYGYMTVHGKRIGAHRLIYFLTYGVMPDMVDHTCHNNSGCSGGNACPHRRCCNPAHLENTTNRINSLRGESVAAHHARKTHCVNGHEFSVENTYLYVWRRTGRGRRMCKKCNRIRQAEAAAKKGNAA
jgi:hypothetical protein